MDSGEGYGEEDGEQDMTKHLFGRLAIALWRGNAGLWLHRHPSLPSTIDGHV